MNQNEQNGFLESQPVTIKCTKEVNPILHSQSQLSVISEENQFSSNRQSEDYKISQSHIFGATKKRNVSEVRLSFDSQSAEQSMKIYFSNQNKTNQTQTQVGNFMKILQKERNIKRFVKNLFINSYILQNSKKHLLHDRFIKLPSQNKSTENNHFQNIPALLPNSKILLLWDFLSIIMSLIILWTTPFLASFGSHLINQFPITMYITILIYQILDIMMNSNRAYILQGQVIKQRKQILKNYFLNYLLHDLLSVVAWTLIFYTFDSNALIKILISGIQLFVTYNKIQRNFSNHFESFYLQGNISHSLDLFSLIVTIYYFAHLSACIWYYIGDSTQYLDTTWLKKYELQNSNIWENYNHAFYWATMTMTTVGYGDIVAQNYVEMIFADIMMFFSSCVFAYSMNSIGIILKSLYDAKLKYKMALVQINAYMSKHQVEYQLQGRIRNYLKFFIESDGMENDEKINKIVSHLPKSLSNELNRDIQMKIIKQMKVIKNIFTSKTQKYLSTTLEQAKFTPGDYIFHKGDQFNQYLYFLMEGEVEMVEDGSQMLFTKCSAGHCFGNYQFFTGFPPKMTARSIGFTECYKVERKKFMEILQYNRKDYETYHHIKDQIMLNSNLLYIDYSCKFCQSMKHFEIDCPMIQYKPDLEQRIKKNQFQLQVNYRAPYKRFRHKMNSRYQFKNVHNSVQQQLLQNSQSLNSSGAIMSYQLIEKQKSNSGSGPQDMMADDDSNYKDASNIKLIRRISTNQKNSIKVDKGKTVIRPCEELTPIRKNNSNPHQDLATSGRRTYRDQSTTLKEFCILDEFQYELAFQDCCIDSLSEFNKYMPQNNVENTIKQATKSLKRQLSRFQFILQYIDKYTFYHQVKIRSLKLKSFFTRKRSSKRNDNNIQ